MSAIKPKGCNQKDVSFIIRKFVARVHLVYDPLPRLILEERDAWIVPYFAYQLAMELLTTQDDRFHAVRDELEDMRDPGSVEDKDASPSAIWLIENVLWESVDRDGDLLKAARKRTVNRAEYLHGTVDPAELYHDCMCIYVGLIYSLIANKRHV